ncbi:putative retrotransposon protein [Gregarina niphandrodes]|uniref:Retrotransposon protein n=1 Tax=Gregarina niphandrodes TaxID=110365 RepID=A0A023B882_GRENI|nr:putative retrotransposon protein [Gregarina niphandrodes]EZG68594.1 putative retrotransposon protein [Gregarina niphandrodes]|eukprot:XP_011134561.1 putative retrotransposon protein [Gregarina niphandrodes]
MVSDAYPIPRLWTNLRTCAGRNYYVTLDMNKGFWNIPLEEESKRFTAFITPSGLFEFNVLPFGIKNSPTAFQRAMDHVFGDLVGKNVFLYIDDVVICGDTKEEVLTLLEKVLQRTIISGFYLRLDKSEWMKPTVDYLGYQVGRDGIKVRNKSVKSVTEAAPPTNKAELQSFLGLVGYLRSFIPRYAEHTARMCELLKKNVQYEWIDRLQLDFDGLKQAYTSRKLSDTERRWDTRERELYAIKYALEKWRDYLGLEKFVVRTDHNNLRYLATVHTGKVQRWALYLAQFNFDIEFLQGSQNNVADWLSRYAAPDIDEDDLLDTMGLPVKQVDKIDVGMDLPSLAEVRRAVQEEGQPGHKGYVERDGRIVEAATGRGYVPGALRARVIRGLHYGRGGAHMGVTKTVRRVAQYFVWPGMPADVAAFVKSCLICARLKQPRSPTHGYEVGHLDAAAALTFVSLDHIGPITYESVRCLILVIMDHATRYMVARVVADTTAELTYKVFKACWLDYFGVPRVMLTDNGGAFRGSFHEQVVSALGVSHLYCSAYRPQANGVNEASHQFLKLGMAALWQEGSRDIPTILAEVVNVYNTTPHRAKRLSPFQSLFGLEPIVPGCQEWAEWDKCSSCSERPAD